MVELQYVKKRKRKKLVAIITAASSCVLVAFIIVAFLGSKVGTFTVSLRNTDVSLSMATHSTFEDRGTYIRIEDIAPLDTYCYQEFLIPNPEEHPKEGEEKIFNYDVYHNEFVSYMDFATYHPETGALVSAPFFKLTFFLDNDGYSSARYDMLFNITLNREDEYNHKKIDDILRVALIETTYIGGIEEKSISIYALKSSFGDHYDPKYPEEKTSLEYICGDATSKKYAGLAEPFIDGTTVFCITRYNFQPSEQPRQYTILYWLEGDDHECVKPKPTTSKLELGVQINAYAS